MYKKETKKLNKSINEHKLVSITIEYINAITNTSQQINHIISVGRPILQTLMTCPDDLNMQQQMLYLNY